MHAPHEHLGHAAPATIPSRCEGRGARSAGDAHNCEHQDFAHARPPPAKHIYIYDVLAAIQRQPCSTPSSRHIAPGMIRAGASGTTTQYDMGGIRRVAPPLRPRRATSPPIHAKTASRAERSANRPSLGHFVTTQTTPLRHHARRGIRQRLSPAHGNRHQVRTGHFKHSISRYCEHANRPCQPPATNKGTPAPWRATPRHVGTHIPGPPRAPSLSRARPATRHQPQRRPTPWPTRPCWLKISDLTLFSHLPLDIM